MQLHPEEWCTCRSVDEYIAEHSKDASWRFMRQPQAYYTMSDAADILVKPVDEVRHCFNGRKRISHAELEQSLFQMYGLTITNGAVRVSEVPTCR